VAADQGVDAGAEERLREEQTGQPVRLSIGRRIGLAFLLVPPMAWLGVVYLGSLAVLLVSAFWSTNTFTGAVVRTFTTDNVVRVFTDPVFRTAAVRTVSVALLVTVICIVLAVPLALYMAKIASPRMRLLLVIAVTTPLWASYLVKAYAWRMLLSPEGPLSWASGYTPGYGLAATVITLTYLWLPYMVIPVFAAFDRVPDSLTDASSDLGASDITTLRTVVAPLVFPGIAAGSIFTFSLSLGDYIAVTIVGGKTQLLGNIIYGQLVTANNQPLAAALSIIPLAAIILYLLAMRRTGALENV
jgi:putative spermidine/putrescine transport system permease protein